MAIPQMIRRNEAARLLSVSERYIDKLIAAKRLKTRRLKGCRAVFIIKSSLEALLERKAATT